MTDEPKIITLTKQNFDSVIAKSSIVVIDFWAEWCEPCHVFDPVFEKVAAQNPDIVFGKVDTEHETELAAEFNIRSIPTLMVLRENIMIYLGAGVLPAQAIQDLIRQAKELNIEEVKKQLGES